MKDVLSQVHRLKKPTAEICERTIKPIYKSPEVDVISTHPHTFAAFNLQEYSISASVNCLGKSIPPSGGLPSASLTVF